LGRLAVPARTKPCDYVVVKLCVQIELSEVAMLRWFERRLDPYPTAEPTQPPAGMLAFLLHYLRGSKRWFAVMMVLTAAWRSARSRCSACSAISSTG